MLKIVVSLLLFSTCSSLPARRLRLKRGTADCGSLDKYGLRTPHFPDNYPTDAHCVYTIPMKPNKMLKLKFLDFDIENSSNCSYDYVEIRDHQQSYGRYCGRTLNGNNIMMDESPYVNIIFHSDKSLTKRGFNMKYSYLDSEGKEIEGQEMAANIITTKAPTTKAPTSAHAATEAPQEMTTPQPIITQTVPQPTESSIQHTEIPTDDAYTTGEYGTESGLTENPTDAGYHTIEVGTEWPTDGGHHGTVDYGTEIPTDAGYHTIEEGTDGPTDGEHHGTVVYGAENPTDDGYDNPEEYGTEEPTDGGHHGTVDYGTENPTDEGYHTTEEYGSEGPSDSGHYEPTEEYRTENPSNSVKPGTEGLTVAGNVGSGEHGTEKPTVVGSHGTEKYGTDFPTDAGHYSTAVHETYKPTTDGYHSIEQGGPVDGNELSRLSLIRSLQMAKLANRINELIFKIDELKFMLKRVQRAQYMESRVDKSKRARKRGYGDFDLNFDSLMDFRRRRRRSITTDYGQEFEEAINRLENEKNKLEKMVKSY